MGRAIAKLLCLIAPILLLGACASYAQTLSNAAAVSTGDGDIPRVQRGNNKVTVN